MSVASILHAQEPASPADEMTEVVLTGTRISRNPNDTAPLPVSSVSSEQIAALGNADATATLRTIPALVSSSTVADSIERGPTGTIGQATLNLRQLGTDRTLVLVDGYRHVSGIAGSQAVDVSTIPNLLIDRVEVLTGGASAVYGADAVTGVVNYVLKRDFDGAMVDFGAGISQEGDGITKRFEGLLGHNFANGRGNFTLAAGFTQENEVLLQARDFLRDDQGANDNTTYSNPLKRFQVGDIVASTMPNFAARYRIGGPGPSAQDFPYGVLIPTPAQAATIFPGGLTAAEQALVTRAANAPLYAISRNPRFSISSKSGIVWRADFDFFGLDLNNNGQTDCFDSFQGRYGLGGGGCYVTTPDGGVRVFQDGVIANTQNQFGGDGSEGGVDNRTTLVPGSRRQYVNLRGQFEFSPLATTFIDAKFAQNDTVSRNGYNTFYDSLLIFPDNPFIPAVLQGEADDAGGLRVSRDFVDLGDNVADASRSTLRIVGGLKGAFSDHFRYELVGNYGRTNIRVTQANSVLPDRLFAAIDVVRDANGQPICRSDIDPTPHPGSEFFPVIEGGFFTFSPGDGQCRPASLFNGQRSLTKAAADFITESTSEYQRLEQQVATLSFSGDSEPLFSLPGGALQFAFGGEYRQEKSSARFSDLELGLLPAGSGAGAAGTFIGDISSLQSLIFDGSTRTFNTRGQFDVTEYFAEVSAPLVRNAFLVEELTVGAAARYADYSTIGGATTWNVNAAWAPVSDLRLRGTYSEAIRAPNIAELFDPQQGTTFRPADPCEQTTIDALIAAGDPAAQNRLNNCRAAGIPVGFIDPLSARFSGTTGGNPDLQEETATTYTYGAVIQPRWVPGLTLSVDYYSIEIEDAIDAVSAQNIVNTCYDLPTFPNQFCGLFTRNTNPASPQFRGLNFLRQTQINFGRIETSGVDFQVNYRFGWLGYAFDAGLTGNWTEKLNRFFDPVDQTLSNPGLLETGAPDWSGVLSLSVARGPATLNYNGQIVGRQAIASAVQIERIDLEFGRDVLADAFMVHNVSGNWRLDSGVEFYGGVNNLANEKPYAPFRAYPVSGMGRFFFAGVRAKF